MGGLVLYLKTLLVFLAFGSSAWAGDVPIKVFRPVTDEIFRGARPGEAGMLALAKLGIKVDLDLEDDDEAVGDESNLARELGMRFVSMPMSGFWAPDDHEVDRILRILEDPSNYPVFVHCEHGQDRTGLVVGLYRVFSQKWEPQDAYREMRELGFHPILFLLKDYFEEKAAKAHEL